MTINEVIESVQDILQRHGDVHPMLYVVGTKDKTAVLINHLPQKPDEREHAFEFTGIKVATAYDLGELTQVYFVR